MDFSERFVGVALITGASSGIGKAFAEALARRGMDLALVARRQDRLEALKTQLESAHGIRCHVFDADLTDPAALSALPSLISSAGLSVGLLINSAGFGYFGPAEAHAAQDAGKMVDLNCRAPVFLTHAFLPDMKAAGRGGIVMVGSTASFVATPYCATYGASKAFDLSFAEALWAELLGSGVTALAVCPGYTQTEFQDVSDAHGMPRLGGVHTPRDIAEGTLTYLGKGPRLIPGFWDRVLIGISSWLPRTLAVRLARRANRSGLGT